MKKALPRLMSGLLALGLLLSAGGLAGLAWNGRFLLRAGLAAPLRSAPGQPGAAVTRTPFLPGRAVLPAAAGFQAGLAAPEATAVPDLHFARSLMAPSPEGVSILIQPEGAHNGGAALRMGFGLGQTCDFGTGLACVSRHRAGQVILLTVHSGLGGEADGFRAAVEGTAIDAAGFPIEQIRANLAGLGGAGVRLSQGALQRDDLELAVVVRVPPMDLERYFALPFDDGLETAANENETLRALLDSGQPLLAFEVCGWHVPGEIWAAGFEDTTAAIYLGFIRVRHP